MKIIPPTNQMKVDLLLFYSLTVTVTVLIVIILIISLFKPRSLTIEDLMAAAKQVDRTVKKEFLRRYSPFISTREE